MLSNNKRIATNTIALYFRHICIMAVTIYTSRIILQVLGVEDYGIYNVVGGLVVLFSFITGTMASASQRFLSFEMPKNDELRLNNTFSLIFLSFIILSLLTVFLSETIAVWFLNSHMNIPEDKISSANYVLQFSIISFVFSIMETPYISVIIANENMNVYAYVSIVEVIVKLLIVYLLQLFQLDKLILYSLLLSLNSLGLLLFYHFYCRRKYKESHYHFYFNYAELKDICSYAMYNVIGAFSNVLKNQGINILLNLFFNPAVNAARGIAFQVNAAISTFQRNFFMAVRPQIVKKYATGQKDEMISLIYNSCRFSYYMVLLLIIPIYFNIEPILIVWLKTPPALTDIFIRIILLEILITAISAPLEYGLQAANKIKKYQLCRSIFGLSNIPVSYFLLKIGMPEVTPFWVSLILLFLSLLPSFYIYICVLHISMYKYLSKVLAPILIVSLVSVVICYFIKINYDTNDLLSLLGSSLMMLMSTLCIICIIGVTHKERTICYNFLCRRLK